MSYEKLNLINGEKFSAEHVSHIEDGIVQNALDAEAQINQIKGDIRITENFAIDGIYNIRDADIVQGSINIDGTDGDATIRLRVDPYIKIKAGSTISFYEGTNIKNIAYYIYDEDKNFVTYQAWESDGFKKTFEQNGFVRFMFKNSSGTTVVKSDYDATTTIKAIINEERFEEIESNDILINDDINSLIDGFLSLNIIATFINGDLDTGGITTPARPWRIAMKDIVTAPRTLDLRCVDTAFCFLICKFDLNGDVTYTSGRINEYIVQEGERFKISIFKQVEDQSVVANIREFSEKVKYPVDIVSDRNTAICESGVLILSTGKMKYVFKRDVDNSKNLDTYRIYSCGVNSLTEVGNNLEIEGPFLEHNAPDFVGGWHGYEQYTDLKIIIDGHDHDIDTDFNIKFDNADIFITSNIYHSQTSIIACNRYINLNFCKNTLTISNTFDVVDDINVVRATSCGLLQAIKSLISGYSTDLDNKFISILGDGTPKDKYLKKVVFFYSNFAMEIEATKDNYEQYYYGSVSNFADEGRFKAYLDAINSTEGILIESGEYVTLLSGIL